MIGVPGIVEALANRPDNGGPAFPCSSGDGLEPDHGMSLRDYFAAHASDADINRHIKNNDFAGTRVSREEARYRHADAMLAARKKEKKP